MQFSFQINFVTRFRLVPLVLFSRGSTFISVGAFEEIIFAQPAGNHALAVFV